MADGWPSFFLNFFKFFLNLLFFFLRVLGISKWPAVPGDPGMRHGVDDDDLYRLRLSHRPCYRYSFVFFFNFLCVCVCVCVFFFILLLLRFLVLVLVRFVVVVVVVVVVEIWLVIDFEWSPSSIWNRLLTVTGIDFCFSFCGTF